MTVYNPCPKSHYWFTFWLPHGYTVTCTRCGATATPKGKPKP